MRIIQLNLNHCEAAQCLLEKTVQEQNADVVLLSEPYKNDDSTTWKCDITGTSAIWSVSGNPITDSMTTNKGGFVRGAVCGITLYSCYIPPRIDIEEFKVILSTIVVDAAGRNNILIVGDFNAWATEWGSSRTNARGREILEAFASLDIILLNMGNQQTFSRNGGGSVIDISFASFNIASRIKWQLSSIYTHSDHNAIIIEIEQTTTMCTSKQLAQINGWKTNVFDQEMFNACMEAITLESCPNKAAEKFMRKITNACDMSMKKRRQGNQRKPVYWWTDEIAQLRKECIRSRRKFTRTRGRPDNYIHHENMRNAKKAIKTAISQRKRACFLEICDDLDNNPFGLAYKIVTKKLKSSTGVQQSDPAVLEGIVRHLFPQQKPTAWSRSSNVIQTEFPEVTAEEIQLAAKKLQLKKAPGPDGVPNMIIKEMAHTFPAYIVELFNLCLRCAVFPKIWKIQKLVLLPKNGKPLDDPSSYRPICLIDTFGKLLESVICSRLQNFIELSNGLSVSQFGFRKNLSTVDAINQVVETAQKAIKGKTYKNDYCLIVTLDVKNAFNTANWDRIVNALQELNAPKYLVEIIKDYFRERVLTYNTSSGLAQYNVSGGVPQGSVLGPLLWNIMYDGVLRLDLPGCSKIIGFADDIVLIVTASTLDETQTVADAGICKIRHWLCTMGLALAEHKTEAVLITSRKVAEYIDIQVGDCKIKTKEKLKYLGVIIDNRLSFKSHIEYIREKSNKSCTSLCRVMPNTRGPRFLRRKILAEVVKSVILYASPIWADCLKYKTYTHSISAVYRTTALRVCCAYRTVSDEAAFVVGGLIPIDLLAKERKLVYEKKLSAQEARDRSLSEWQTRWSTSTKSRWTYELIPNIKNWMDRKYGDVDFYVTQFLTGHGCFREYLNRFGLKESAACPYCYAPLQNARHVFFDCPRFDNERGLLNAQLSDRISVERITQIMVGSQAHWDSIANYVKLVLLELRRNSLE